MALSRSSRSGRFLRGSSLVVCNSSFQSRVCGGAREADTGSACVLTCSDYPLLLLPPSRQAQRLERASWRCTEGAWHQEGWLGGRGRVAPVQECAPRSPALRYRRPQHAHSPWHALPGEQSSCIPGTEWQSSRTGGVGPCRSGGMGEWGIPPSLVPSCELLFSEVPAVLAFLAQRCHPEVRSKWVPLPELLPP